ncbi:PKD domain-containing protein [Algoriphagus taiwanensis]|uniref:PKD domain-containing protein n=1 Tax=Algoriphagus taiwanensis TaxID=1445656 RepID=A0ABQ6Q2S3_9BACT|nr:hypothetical protein Ataiwa_27030 [Algoriphagus taiwanensis]
MRLEGKAIGISSILALLLFLLPLESFSQVNTLGKEFFVGFLENGRPLDSVNVAPEKALIILTANERSIGTITTPRQSIPFELEKGQQFVREFDANAEGLILSASGRVEKRFVQIVSSGELAVHALNGRSYSTDGTVVLPKESLGLDYLVMSHHERALITGSSLNHTTLESSLLVLGTEDNTEVEIIPSARTQTGIPINYSLKITLNQGDAYQIKADADLTGTIVRVINDNETNCKKVAVFGGNRMSSSGICGTTGDHLFHQAYPTNTWGKSFVHIPLKDRTSGEFVKILAMEDNTEVYVNGRLETRLNARKYTQLEFDKSQVVHIETSKPASMAVLSKSGFCNEFFVASLGDPTLFAYSPTNQMIREAPFSTGKLYGRFNISLKHYINVLVNKGTASQTKLDGQNIGSLFRSVLGADFEYLQMEVSEGPHILSNPEGFIGYVYGSGQVESYGYPIGLGMESIQFETETNYAFEVEGDRVGCLNQEGTWKILPEDPIFTEFEWNFGDSTSLKQGQEVSHTFTQPGKYLVEVFASSGSGDCDEQETFRFEVEVKEISAQISGPESVCPLLDEQVYNLTDTVNVHRVDWEIEGGEILEESLESVKVRWGAPSTTAFIRATPFTDQGCPGETVRLNVEITEAIEPALPKGDSGLCGGENDLIYEVPFPNENRIYTWTVTGGVLTSGQGTAQVNVTWDLNAPVKKIFYEEKNTANPSCFGVSEALSVVIYPEFRLGSADVLTPACPGQSNGRIQVNPQGGSGVYDFEWSHDPKLNSAVAQGLPSGTYEVWVRDRSGCAEEQLSITLEEPQALEVQGEPDAFSVSCFGGNDGMAEIRLRGGTPPYSAVGFQSIWDGNVLQVLGLEAGENEILVEDQRGCQIGVSLEIESPDELTVLALVNNPGCEGSLDGELELQISGGTGPYEVIWDNGQTGNRLVELPFGEFGYTITDAEGCVLTGKAQVNQAKAQVRMPTGFDPERGRFGPVSNCSIDYELFIWDKWGGLVYRGREPWDGLLNGTETPPGSFSFLIRYSYQWQGERVTEEQKGVFTLIR